MSLRVWFDHHFPTLHLEVAFEAPTPGVTALFGPSGCGKSTVIMAVAGLLRPERCRITLDGAVLADTEAGRVLAPEQRRIGMVFQDSRLFPHMSVRRNLEFGKRRTAAGPIRLDDVVELLGIGHLLARRPLSLSGGERQRVAIGRALLAQPTLLLMDEPLASLDGARKREILVYLSRIKTALKLPILYVTHSTEELASLTDTLVLLDRGHVVAAGPFAEIVARSDLPLARRDDAGAVLTMRVAEHDAARELTGLEAGGILLWVPLLDRPRGAAARVRVPAREVLLATSGSGPTSADTVGSGRVRAISPDATGRTVLVEVSLPGDNALLARVTPEAVQRLGLAVDREVTAMIKPMLIEVLPG
jgi:molybdate transport system ATP-binding protein